MHPDTMGSNEERETEIHVSLMDHGMLGENNVGNGIASKMPDNSTASTGCILMDNIRTHGNVFSGKATPNVGDTEEKCQCRECGKEFCSPSVMRRHMRSVHSKTSFMCTICGKTYTRRDSWLQHTRKQHVQQEYMDPELMQLEPELIRLEHVNEGIE